jgi:hypothetical protein
VCSSVFFFWQGCRQNLLFTTTISPFNLSIASTTPTSTSRGTCFARSVSWARFLLCFKKRAMVRASLSRCIRQGVGHCRSFHISTAFRDAQPSIAQVLDVGPIDSDKVVINGFIRSIRNQKQRSFASIGDGSSLEPLQALLTPEQAQRLELSIPHSRAPC